MWGLDDGQLKETGILKYLLCRSVFKNINEDGFGF
jgi:hypothetical protein